MRNFPLHLFSKFHSIILSFRLFSSLFFKRKFSFPIRNRFSFSEEIKFELEMFHLLYITISSRQQLYKKIVFPTNGIAIFIRITTLFSLVPWIFRLPRTKHCTLHRAETPHLALTHQVIRRRQPALRLQVMLNNANSRLSCDVHTLSDNHSLKVCCKWTPPITECGWSVYGLSVQ